MKQTISKTKEELLQNTINHYNINNRAVNTKGKAFDECIYITSDGNRCAIGKELKKSLCIKLAKNNEPVSCLTTFKKLPKRLKNMGENFLSVIQTLHDEPLFWNKNGLSHKGKLQVEKIKNKYLNKQS